MLGFDPKKKKKKKVGLIRIAKDIKDMPEWMRKNLQLNNGKLDGFEYELTPKEGLWKDVIHRFRFKIDSVEYPIVPPKVKCITNVWHPNINKKGSVCLNILRDEWNPCLGLKEVIFGLYHLFYNPNPDDPLNIEAGKMFEEDMPAFIRKALEVMRK